MGEEEGNGLFSIGGNVKKPLCCPAVGTSPHPEVPGQQDSRTDGRLLGECRASPVACREGPASLWQCQPPRTGAGKREASSSCLERARILLGPSQWSAAATPPPPQILGSSPAAGCPPTSGVGEPCPRSVGLSLGFLAASCVCAGAKGLGGPSRVPWAAGGAGGGGDARAVPAVGQHRPQRQRLFPPPGERCAGHGVCALVLAVLVALVLALGAAVAVQSAGRRGGNADRPVAAVLACPWDWVGYRNVCYYLSSEEGSWEWSQERCSSLGASLAVLKMVWEMDFLWYLKGNVDYWLGLRRWGERLEWVDGSSFNLPIRVWGREPCLYLNDRDLASSSCSQSRPYLCSKPQALMGQS
ncbi:uncharacterized protein LJ206_020674 [Theristicus caerulescens]